MLFTTLLVSCRAAASQGKCAFVGCSICFSTCNVCVLQSHSFTKYDANFWVLANHTGEKLYILPSYLNSSLLPPGNACRALCRDVSLPTLHRARMESHRCTLFLNDFEIHLLCCAYNSFFLTAGETPTVGHNPTVPRSDDVFPLAANRDISFKKKEKTTANPTFNI